MIFELGEPREIFVKILFVIEPPVNDAPGTWPAVDEHEISFADGFVQSPVGLGEEIAQLHCGIGRDTPQAIANAARRAVMAFTIARRQDQDLFHDSLGESRLEGSGRSLMDIYVGQSKLSVA